MATEGAVTTAYPGARVTRLVNRRGILDAIELAVRDDSQQTYVFYIEADGGMGKTFLAREVLRRCRKGGAWASSRLLAARDEVDFYHYPSRTIEGFMASFVQALQAGRRYFAAYREQNQHLQDVKANLRGAINELTLHRELLHQRLLEGCEELGSRKRIVVVLDTAERLAFETDRFQQTLGLSEEASAMRPWLLKHWLPRMRNAVILVCGRPRMDAFAAELKAAVEACPNAVFRDSPKLQDFGEEETLDYIRAVEETAEQDGNLLALKRLQAISPEGRQVIHHLTGGRPITLALIIDYYLATERLLPEIKIPLEELQSLSEEELTSIQDRVKADIVRLFREIGRPADEVIIALAWAPMGMDAELLSRVAEMGLAESRRVLKTLADRKRGLSFVKIRPGDKRAFLHDEMYALMRKYVLKTLEPRAGRVREIILEYYAEKIKAKEKRVQQLHAQQQARVVLEGLESQTPAAGVPADPEVLAAAEAELDDLRVEEVYYRLRQEPLDGFAQYCEYAEAAVMSYNESLETQLRGQMSAFIREAFGVEQEVRGLRRDAVERVSALLWGWRSLYAGRPKEADRLIHYLREEEPEFIDRGGTLTRAELDIIGGWTAAFLGRDLGEAEDRLKTETRTLENLRPTTNLEQLRRQVLLAQAHNVLGYLLRVQGRFQAACEAYRRALPLWRDLKREADHAEASNNLAWAYTEAGNFRRAIRTCQNGLDLREKVGDRYPIALSYNTLGLIEIKHDQPHRGMVHCERALGIFRDLGTVRGIGLACTAIAEAYRRSADLVRLYPPAERVRRLHLATQFAGQAVQIFREEVPEQLRLVEALNELGCVYRNRARFWTQYHTEEDPDRDTLVQQGIDTLEEASREAGETFVYRQVDALVNLAWLYFYIGAPRRQAEEVLQRAEALIPPSYWIVKGKGLPQMADPITFLWVQLSKSHVLRGELAMQQYWAAASPARGTIRDLPLLQEAVEQFTLALAYGELFGDDYRDLRQAKDTIYDQVRKANTAEMRAIYEAVEATAKDYSLDYCPARPGQIGRPGEPARPRMRNFLEENFSTLEELEKGRSWIVP
jgi:tetratricopeptide (TPR) repeat protein